MRLGGGEPQRAARAYFPNHHEALAQKAAVRGTWANNQPSNNRHHQGRSTIRLETEGDREG